MTAFDGTCAENLTTISLDGYLDVSQAEKSSGRRRQQELDGL